MKKTRESESLMVKFHDFAQIRKLQKDSGKSVLYTKAISILIIYVALWVKATFFLPEEVWAIHLWYTLRAISIVLVGFWILHDVGHGAFFHSSSTNRKLYRLIEALIGANIFLWVFQHNAHHGSPNSPDDTDIQQAPFMRLHKDQELKWYHRYQYIYAFPLYSLGYIAWVGRRDFKRMFWTGRIDDGKSGRPQKLKVTKQQQSNMLVNKGVFVLITIVIPIVINGWSVVLPIIVMLITVGFLLSLVFQLAHVNTFSRTLSLEEVRKMDYLEMQLATTTDFATGPIWTQILGGLNLQVVHHVAMNVDHTKLYEVSKLLKRFAREHGLKYHRVSFPRALWSHLVMLYRYGRA